MKIGDLVYSKDSYRPFKGKVIDIIEVSCPSVSAVTYIICTIENDLGEQKKIL